MLEIERRLESPAETAALGAAIGAALRPGDVVCLTGPLGAGKTTLARGAIAARAGEAFAPSPTFSLVETYSAGDLSIWHFDLYRLARAEDVVELGLEEALARGASLIEWPEKIADLIPAAALAIRLEPEGAARRARILAGGDWAARLKLEPARESPQSGLMSDATSRATARARFLDRCGWSDAAAEPLAGDASTRSYERLRRGDEVRVLMNAPPAAEGSACPPDASPDARRALGYNAMARLAGPNLNAFTALAGTLRAAGLAAPQVFAADPETGFALLEDFGDDLFARAISRGANPQPLYEAAVDALLHLAAARPAPPAGPHYAMLTYDRTALEAEIGLVLDWYWPHRKGRAPEPADRAAYFAAWEPALAQLSAPRVIVLRDFHAENLFWLPARAGPQRVGLIDFQDGLVGSPAYDLASLLEDARRDVEPALAEAMIARYLAGARSRADFSDAAFLADYAILAAQRNAKILGIFARLVHRDGKPRYLDFLPRVERYFRADLQRPALRSVRDWFAARLPELAS